MWLIHTPEWKLVEFVDPQSAPNFAILSHTWGDGEISFQEFSQDPHSEATIAKLGYTKIRDFCRVAMRDFELEYCWADTCCIDKKSSAELSEAINSMYKYYEYWKVCIVYFADICARPHCNGRSHAQIYDDLPSSRWFTRGWTLQELLAPKNIEFYDHTYFALGNARHKNNVACIIKATGISNIFLKNPKDCSVAMKMSWAANRETTRVEDIAYCLMGLFDISMPLLYGEGMKAFRRLQEEIIKSSNDESVFAWASDRDDRVDDSTTFSGILAPSPSAFANSGDLVPCHPPRPWPQPYAITNYGLQIELTSPRAVRDIYQMHERLQHPSWDHRAVPFACTSSDGSVGYLKIWLGAPSSDIVRSDTQREILFRRNPHFIEFFQIEECRDIGMLDARLYFIQI